jgi:hypothetical protein
MSNPSDARTGSIPPAYRLEQAALRLAEAGDHRTLISMVERWAQLGDPTPRALLAQIRAMLDLCMMDRAWTRLQALPEDPALLRERNLLTARMFLERGWPRRARKVLDEAREAWPDDPEVRRLAAQLERPAPPTAAAEVDPDAPFADQLAMAESWLATGAFLKARRLLEQLQRRAPEERRPAELLWALRGDFDLHGTTLQALVKAHAPTPMAFSEPPESASPAPVAVYNALPAADLGGGSAPNLGTLGDLTSLGPELTEDEAEITQATRLDDLVASSEGGAKANAEERDEDTQVLRIVSSEPTRRSAPGAAWSPEPPTSPGIADELEGEDEAVVLLTRHAERQPPQRTNAPQPAPDLGPRRQPEFPPPPLAQPAPPPPPAIVVAEEEESVPVWVWVLAAGLGGAGVALGGIAAWMYTSGGS